MNLQKGNNFSLLRPLLLRQEFIFKVENGSRDPHYGHFAKSASIAGTNNFGP